MKLILESWRGFLNEQEESTFEFARELSQMEVSDEQISNLVSRLSYEDLEMLKVNLAAIGTEEAFSIRS